MLVFGLGDAPLVIEPLALLLLALVVEAVIGGG